MGSNEEHTSTKKDFSRSQLQKIKLCNLVTLKAESNYKLN